MGNTHCPSLITLTSKSRKAMKLLADILIVAWITTTIIAAIHLLFKIL
jgi:hypothetical protein